MLTSLSKAYGFAYTEHPTAVQVGEFIEYVKSVENTTSGNAATTLRVIQHEEDFGHPRSASSAGGPESGVRYIVDPANPNQVIDMRHFLVVGEKGETFGLGIEIAQSLPKIGDPASAFNAQDFLSNTLGKEFFSKYYNPKGEKLSNQLQKFFYDRGRGYKDLPAPKSVMDCHPKMEEAPRPGLDNQPQDKNSGQ